MTEIRDKIIEGGVKSLADFGFKVDSKSIFVDHVYKRFFNKLLCDIKGEGNDEVVNEAIDKLIEETN